MKWVPPGNWYLLPCILILLGLLGCQDDHAVTGTLESAETLELPGAATVMVFLEDVTDEHAAPEMVTKVRLDHQGKLPLPFVIEFDPETIKDDRKYSVHGLVREGPRVLFVTDPTTPVITHGHGKKVALTLHPVTPWPALEGTYWKLMLVNGEPVKVSDSGHEASLVLDHETRRMAGSGGCNRLHCSYEKADASLTFGQVAATLMACPDMAQEQAFLKALEATTAWRIDDKQLLLLDPEGTELAVFVARPHPDEQAKP